MMRFKQLMLGLYLLLVVVATHAQGLQGLQNSENTTKINESQTVDEVVVTLDWVYAETGQVAVRLVMSVLDEEGNLQPLSEPPGQSLAVQLYDPGGSFKTNFVSDTFYARGLNQSTLILGFDVPQDFEMGEEMELTLEAVFNQKPEAGTIFDLLFGVRSGSTAMSGGMRRAAGTPEPLQVPEGGVGPFTFDFTVPVNVAVNTTEKQSVEAQGFTMTLERVTATPTQIDVELCLTAPDDETRFWMPEVELETPMYDFPYTGFGYTTSIDENSVCYFTEFSISREELPETLTFRVALEDRAMTITDKIRMAKMLQERGANIEVDERTGDWGGGGFQITLMNEVKVELGYRLEDDWVFNVELPE